MDQITRIGMNGIVLHVAINLAIKNNTVNNLFKWGLNMQVGIKHLYIFFPENIKPWVL